ncbi:MAG: Sec-independent protein translocase protein TatB [Xanthobacteraceae bacterium]|nr:Sec-independent protein translocase protein TatB [Xanthobacteraceae bacterium]
MFDIGWSELVVIGVVALIAIGPKELPGVLRTVGQWMGKVRRMAAEFQGQFNEAMREAEMADLKKSFDEIKDTATSLSKNNILTSLTQEASDALKVGDLNAPPSSTAASSPEPAPPPAETATQIETQVETHGAVSEPLAIAGEATAAPPQAAEAGAADRYLDADLRRDAKAS